MLFPVRLSTSRSASWAWALNFVSHARGVTGVRVRAFNPYLLARGGGEHYFLEACLALSVDHTVEVVSPSREPMSRDTFESVARTFGLDVGSVGTVAWARGMLGLRSLKKTLDTGDLALTVANRYPKVLGTRHASILQFPWGVATWSDGRRAKARRALDSCQLVITYSGYVRSWVERALGYSPEVLYPPVAPIFPGEKGPIILSVGRMTAGGHNKKHGAMIEAFRRLEAKGINGWSLVLVGSAGRGDLNYIEGLRKSARGSHVEILPNVDRASLEALYARASLYWHATGYGEDERIHPEHFEHFGIAVVEAMSAGCVPIVLNGGGLPEIVRHGVSGWLWDDIETLLETTARLASDPGERGSLAAAATERAKAFHPSIFRSRLRDMLLHDKLT